MYVTGDLAWLSTMLGKEDMSSHWCHICKLAKEVWAEEGHSKEEPWTIQRIIDMANQNKKGKDRIGVKIEPFWDFIPIKNYIISMLHVMIGVGDDILTYFTE